MPVPFPRRFGPARRLFHYLHPSAGWLVIGLGATAVASLLDGLTVVLLAPLLDSLFGAAGALGDTPARFSLLLHDMLGPVLDGASGSVVAGRLVGILLVALVLKNVCIVAADQCSTTVEEGLVRDLRVDLYRHLLRLDLGFLQRTRTGELIAATMVDIDQAKKVVAAALASFIRNGIVIAVTLVILFNISWQLTLLTVATAPLLIVTIRVLLRRLRQHAREWAAWRGELSATVAERLGAIKLIRAMGTEGREVDRFAHQADQYRKRVLRTQRFSASTSPMSEVFGGVVIVLVIWMAFQPTLVGTTVAPAETIVFLVAALKMMSPLKSITQFPAQMTTALAGAERVFDLLDRPGVEPDEEERIPVSFRDRIEFDRVSFRYDDGPWVLREVSFAIPRGRVIAVVGASGAGKTTLAELLLRFHDPLQGELRLDGRPLPELSRWGLRQLFGVVGQETTLLNDTVVANIAYGHPRATRDEVVAAAKAAHAHEFIRSLPRGYETLLGERGMRLSGGQRQRIAIARALLRDPPILILDEATSALDAESESVVHEAIDRLAEDRTVLVIAHRLTTIQDADEVIVLAEGRVVDRGHHRDLILRDGVYRRLYERRGVATVGSAG